MEGGGVAATISGPRRTGRGERGGGDGEKPVFEQKVIAGRLGMRALSETPSFGDGVLG